MPSGVYEEAGFPTSQPIRPTTGRCGVAMGCRGRPRFPDLLRLPGCSTSDVTWADVTWAKDAGATSSARIGAMSNDLLPVLPARMRRICSGSGPSWAGWQTRPVWGRWRSWSILRASMLRRAWPRWSNRRVEALVAKAVVNALDDGVLRRLAGRDVVPCDALRLVQSSTAREVRGAGQ